MLTFIYCVTCIQMSGCLKYKRDSLYGIFMSLYSKGRQLHVYERGGGGGRTKRAPSSHYDQYSQLNIYLKIKGKYLS